MFLDVNLVILVDDLDILEWF